MKQCFMCKLEYNKDDCPRCKADQIRADEYEAKKQIQTFCPGCYCVYDNDTITFDIKPHQTKDDNVFNTANQEACNNCECNEDYFYVDEVNVLDVLYLIASKGYSF